MITLRALPRALAIAGLSMTLAATPSLASTSGSADAADRAPSSSAPEPAAAKAPRLTVRTVESGLAIPWDLTFLPNGGMLYTQRDKKQITYRAPNGRRRVVAKNPPNVWASGETGMMAILRSRSFRKSRLFFTCHGSTAGGSPDVRVVLWRLNKGFRKARRVKNIVTGLPASSGRHGGCRLAYGPEGALYIGTGDAAETRNPQNLRSGGGKVLRVVPGSGRGWPSNPYAGADSRMKRRVFTHGHRNVQGLARRRDGRMWSVEHGTFRDDEANLLRKGGDYGWQPGPGYDESPPMTNHRLPGRQVNARWRSGNPTIAPSGATWITGRKWGVLQGGLALGVLGSEELLVLKFSKAGKLVRTFKPAALDGDFGRLRSVVMGSGNNLFITTANGSGDRILKVSPRRG